jgi:hypothetical protein
VDITRDITFQYISRLRHHTDELGLVVQGHLLIEYVLNEIIRHRFVRPAAILNDHRSYSFAIKARVLYSTGFLPLHIFRNVQRINSIRNHLAHDLRWDALKLDYRFSRDDDGEKRDITVRDQRTGQRANRRKYIKMLCVGTLSQLRNHYHATIGGFPAPEESP